MQNNRSFKHINHYFNFVFIFYSVSLSSQRKWTILYSSMLDIRNKNNNIIDYISKTEQYLLNEIEHQNNIRMKNSKLAIFGKTSKSSKHLLN